MVLQWITKEGSVLSISSKEAFESSLGVKYLPCLAFMDKKTENHVKNAVAHSLKKHRITMHQKWLGVYYGHSIRKGVSLDLTIRWMDEQFGYGLWTNREIPASAFVGEYTGILRKRKFWGRWKNHYCFLYDIGEVFRTSYVIDAEKQGNHTRFINHSEDGNLEAASVYCEGLIHIILYAKKAIAAGTQLCYDYGPDYWKRRQKPKNLSMAKPSV